MAVWRVAVCSCSIVVIKSRTKEKSIIFGLTKKRPQNNWFKIGIFFLCSEQNRYVHHESLLFNHFINIQRYKRNTNARQTMYIKGKESLGIEEKWIKVYIVLMKRLVLCVREESRRKILPAVDSVGRLTLRNILFVQRFKEICSTLCSFHCSNLKKKKHNFQWK